MKNYFPLGLLLGTAMFLIPANANAQSLFDIDGGGGPTQTGWTSVLVPGTGSTTSATDVNGVTLTLSGNIAGRGRDRGTAATTQGADNNDNAVPEGTFSALYRDLVFVSNNDVLTVSLTGLLASTTYDITAWSYDSGAFGAGTPVNQNFIDAGASVLANLAYSGDLSGGLGPDPNTNLLTDYAATFQLTTDATGATSFTTVSGAGQGARLNGLRVVEVQVVPEPSSLLVFGSLVGLVGLRRRR